MKRKRFALALIGSAASAGSAAAEMPRYDVDSYCERIARVGGDYSAVMFDGCFEMEQSAYDALKARWNKLSSEMRGYCDRVARVGGDGSYSMLQGCVEIEKAASSNQKTFKY